MKDIICITVVYIDDVYKSNLQIYGCFHVIRSVIALCHCMLLRGINGSHKDNGLGLINSIIGDHIIELSINAHMLWKAQTGINGFLPICAIYELSICFHLLKPRHCWCYLLHFISMMYFFCVKFSFICFAKQWLLSVLRRRWNLHIVRKCEQSVYRLRCIYESAQSRSAVSLSVSFLVSMGRSVFKEPHNPQKEAWRTERQYSEGEQGQVLKMNESRSAGWTADFITVTRSSLCCRTLSDTLLG